MCGRASAVEAPGSLSYAIQSGFPMTYMSEPTYLPTYLHIPMCIHTESSVYLGSAAVLAGTGYYR